jgi:hypothetical protein
MTSGFTTIHALVDLTVDAVSLHRETDGVAPNSDDAVKEWFNPFEGLTPGFWRGGNGLLRWNEVNDSDFNPAGRNPYGSGELWKDQTVFAGTTADGKCVGPDDFSSICESTMLEIVGSGGGSDWVAKAARDAIAAGLNATHGGVEYPVELIEIQNEWAAALTTYCDSGETDTSGLEAFHTKYAAFNEIGGDINS